MPELEATVKLSAGWRKCIEYARGRTKLQYGSVALQSMTASSRLCCLIFALLCLCVFVLPGWSKFAGWEGGSGSSFSTPPPPVEEAY